MIDEKLRMVGGEAVDKDKSCTSTAIGSPVSLVLDSSTSGIMMARLDIEEEDIQMRHLTAWLMLGDRCIVDGELMGLNANLLAECSHFRAVKNNAGSTEETDKKIPEAVQNCH